ncbi:S26 family signal peptidase [Planobispora takensis]|uniref:S26 family signal peptidase n=1 Tax=Planobispora takensis TaxID=1367882 RepID=A0A8J3SWS3_9ACTN|nr:S26 family signal peptidase [Planobispora takensis]GII01086.1 S26 family signal peptidase [Planobispora takensis]
MTALVLGAILVAFASGMVGRLRGRYVVVTVHGASMSPTYRDGQRLLVRRRDGGCVVGGQSVVYIDAPDLSMPAALRSEAPYPGPLHPETLHSGVSHSVALHPETAPPWAVKRVAAAPGDPVPRDRFPVLDEVVPAARLVVEGDNPAYSYDSRHFGYLPTSRVVGVVIRRL